MAFPYGQHPLRPTGGGTNISQGEKPRESLTNGSSARKYAAKDLVTNHPTSDHYSSNSEHLVSTASGLKTSAISAQEIVKHGLADLANIRAQLFNVTGLKGSDIRTPGQSFNEHDLSVQQKNLTDRVHAGLGNHPIPAIDRMIKRTSQGIITHSMNGAFRPNTKGAGNSVNWHAPKIDHIRVDVQFNRSVHDVFQATMVYDVPISALSSGEIVAVRIFRATVDDPSLKLRPRLSVQGAERLRSDLPRTRSKNQDYLGNFEQVMRELGIDNAITALNPFDPTRKRRTGAETINSTALDHHAAHENQISRDRNAVDLASWINPQSFLNVDRSVITNIKSIKNMQDQNPNLTNREIGARVRVGSNMYHGNAADKVKGEAIRQARVATATPSPFLLSNGNKLEFKEVAVISAEKLEGQLIGDYFESYYVDHTVTYGKQYLYYVLTVDRNMAQSQRSAIVKVTVDGYRHPGPVSRLAGYPINNSISLSMACDDMLVEKFEVYRKELTGAGHPAQAEIKVHGAGGFHTSLQISSRLTNGFMKIGECINGGKTGSTFYDRNARPGSRYVYRVLTVDVFGNRNSEAKELEVFYPEATKHIHLATPTIKSEIDAKTNKIRVTLTSDDTHIRALMLTRRDLTIGQNDFGIPGSPERLKMGQGDRARSKARFTDMILGPTTDNKLSWNGFFDLAKDRNIVFVDKTVHIDHTYQYRVYGIDKFGNKTPMQTSGKVTVIDMAQVDTPRNLVGAIELDANGSVAGIKIRWEDAMVNYPAEDQLGNQEDLRQTSVRTLFQVERRASDEDIWHSFPMTSQLELMDSVRPVIPLPPPAPLYPTMHPANYQSRALLRNIPIHFQASHSPAFVPSPSRLPAVEMNKTYVYRVQAFQSGGFISNFSPQIAVTVAIPATDPVGFSCKLANGDTKVRPVQMVVQWTTPKDSGPVDYWEIEKSVINIYAAGNFSNANPDDFARVKYSPFKIVHLESQQDSSHVPGMIAPKGYSYITDMDIPLGNMIFYRIRAHAAVGGSISSWIYTAFKIRDADYEAKQAAIAAEEERKRLAAEYAAAHPPAPIVIPKPVPPSTFAYVPSPAFTIGAFLASSYIATTPAIRYVPPAIPARVVVPPPPVTYSRAFIASSFLRFRF